MQLGEIKYIKSFVTVFSSSLNFTNKIKIQKCTSIRLHLYNNISVLVGFIRDGSSLVVLSECKLHIEEWDTSQKEHQDVGDQK